MPGRRPGIMTVEAARGPSVARPIPTSRRQRRRSWATGCLMTLQLLIVLLVILWPLVVQPALHHLVANDLRSGLTELVTQTPPLPSLPPSRVTAWTLVIHPQELDTSLDSSLGAMGTIVRADTTLLPSRIVISLQALGISSTVSATPRVSGSLVLLTQVQITGPLSWILTSEEIQVDVNQAITALLTREGLQATGVTLHPTELIVTFIPAGQ